MARVLFVWELGAGLGHLMQMLPLIEGLGARGHTIFAALKDLSRVNRVFGRTRVSLLQAPTKTRPQDNLIRPGWIFAHILHNTGFSDLGELAAMVDAWRNIYESVQPDLTVFDHSPSALLASRGYSFKRVVIGSGFCVPPDCSPLPNLRPWAKADPAKLWADERRVLDRVNRLLGARRLPALERVTQLYGEVDETLLVTFRELDHYPDRQGARYWGVWNKSEGVAPQWPNGRGKRIYAYLKPFAALPQMLGLLKELGHPTIVLSDGISPAIQHRFGCETLRFESRHLNMDAVAQQCDLAILNAGHGTTAAMLLAGRPVLELPIFLEQGMLARAVQQMGAGLWAPTKSFKHIAQALQRMLASDQFTLAARQFGAKYAQFNPEQHKQDVLRRVEQLLVGGQEAADGKAVRGGSPFSVGAGAITGGRVG